LVIEALRARPGLRVQLTAFAAASTDDGVHLEALRAAAARDPRILLCSPIWGRPELLAELSRHHYLVVPSLWLETGPMVVLEARAAGVPVIGSRLGGLAELIRDGVDGLLLPPGDVHAWRSGLERVVSDFTLFETLRRSIVPPRTMTAVAEEMAGLYNRVASGAAAADVADRPDRART
jgi:glycosyltransferase involved in cell wall biosynthesis